MPSLFLEKRHGGSSGDQLRTRDARRSAPGAHTAAGRTLENGSHDQVSSAVLASYERQPRHLLPTELFGYQLQAPLHRFSAVAQRDGQAEFNPAVMISLRQHSIGP
jgi:hypothetical protein